MKLRKIKFCIIGILIIALIITSGCLKRTGPQPTEESLTGLPSTPSPTTLSTPSSTPPSIAPSTAQSIENIKVAVVYDKLDDNMQNEIGRSTADKISLLKQAQVDMIFYGWVREFPTAVTCNQLPSNQVNKCKSNSASYESFQNAVTQIKAANPKIIIIGSVMVQRLDKDIMNNITGEISGSDITYPATWNMALDPAKWEITTVSKVKLQCQLAEKYGFMGTNTDCNSYDAAKANAYVPDITNVDYQNILKSYIDKQMQAGADGIWLDQFYVNAQILYKLTNDQNSPAVKESTAAIESIIDWFHNKYHGKYIGSYDPQTLPFFTPKLDFVTLMAFPTSSEITSMQINDALWKQKISSASRFGVPIITFIDWGWGKDPMYYFSQSLNSAQQSQFLQIAESFLKSNGVIFAYPMHGEYLGHEATIFAYGKYPYYDSLAPEFQTYNTIVELAKKRKST